MKPIFYFVSMLFFLFPFCCKADATDLYKVKTDRTGNIYVLGEFSGEVKIGSFVLGDSSNYYYPYYFIAKFTPSGAVLWAETIVGVEDGCVGNCPGYVGLVIDNDNSVIISLSSNDSVKFKGVSYYQPNIIKLDSVGNLLFTKRIRELNMAETDVSIDSKNNIYYASVFDRSISSDSITLITCDSTSHKSFVAKISPSGATKWIREIASPISGYTTSLQECFFITTDSNGNSYVGGTSNNTISLDTNIFTCAGFCPFLAKLDSNGNPVFLKGFTERWIYGTGYSHLADGCISNDQKIIVCGSFRDTVNVGPSNVVVTRANVVTPYLSTTNISNGNELWYQYNQNIDSSWYWSNLYDVSSDSSNNILVIGDMKDRIQFYNGAGLSSLTPSLSNTYFAKFDSAGNFQCYKTDSTRLVAGTAHGSNYYTISLTNGSIYFGVLYDSIEIVKWDIASCSKVWTTIIKQAGVLPPPGNVSTVSNNAKRLSFFPNPSNNGVFFKKTNSTLTYSVEMFSINGQRIDFSDSQYAIDISEQPKGIYLYRVVFGDQTVETGKIVYQ